MADCILAEYHKRFSQRKLLNQSFFQAGKDDVQAKKIPISCT